MPDDAQVNNREGQILADRYRIVKLLGEGGMGEVYEAEHIYIKKKVALKLLRNEITSNAEAVTRFHQEALAASTIGHENIVIIDDFGRLPDGSVYLTMEYLTGESLSDLMLKGRLAPDRAMEIMIQMCRGLAAAHSKGIIHRDMKPENIQLVPAEDGTELAKILDFGIAKVSSADSGENLTRTGTIFGTPHYMSPEQAMGRQLDHRTDIYSCGVIMYELFTGTVPFKAESFMGILTQHITALPQAPRTCAPDREIHPEIERVILTAMAKEPEKRYPSMVEMLEDLQNVRKSVTDLSAAMPASAGGGGGWATTAGTQARPVVSQPTGPGPAAPSPTVMSAAAPGGPPPGAPTGGPPPTTAMATAPPMAMTSSPSSPSVPAMPAAHVSSASLPPGQITVSQGGGGAKIGIIIGVIILLLGGGGAGAYFLLAGKDDGGDKKEKTAQADPDAMDAMGDDGMDAMDPDAMGDDGMKAADAMDPDAMKDDGMKAADAMGADLPDPMGADAMGADAMDAMRPEPMAAEAIVVKLKTTPRGVSVTKNGSEECTTPCSVKVPAGSSETFVLKKRGYHQKSVAVTSNGPRSLTFKLKRDRRAVAVRRPPMRQVVIRVMRRRPMYRPMRRRRGSSADPFADGID